MLQLELSIIAPIPVGHHVTAIPIEHRVIGFGDPTWVFRKEMIVCDDETRIVYTSRGVGAPTMTYESISFLPDSFARVSPSIPPLRGRVTGCVVRTDVGDTIRMSTVLTIAPDP